MMATSILWRVLFTLSNSAIINTVPRSSLDNKDRDWWNIFRTTRQPFVWERYTVKPITLDKYTPSPNDYESKFVPGNSGPVFIIFIIFMIVGFIAILIVFCYQCNKRKNTQSTNNNSNMVSSTAPPLDNFEQPRYIVDFMPHPVYRPFIPNQPEQVYRAPTSDQPTPVQRGTASNAHLNRSNAAEKPPGYAEVAISDLNAGHNKFPEVKPSIPETPPPKYGEESMLKY